VRHTDPDRLALIALGDERATPADSDHLASCASCGDDLHALRQTAALARETRAERGLPMPPATVWDRIAAETGADGTAAHAAGTRTRPARRHVVVAAAAAALLGAAGTAGVTAALRDDAPAPRAVQERTVARTTLDRVPPAPPTASGEVEVVRTGGRVELRLRMTGLPATDGLYQVWLYDGDATMIPLGVLNGGRADMTVPDGIALEDFPVVDVSAQRLGQQEHGVSVLQGTLR
jgi:hypothetical protein